MATEQMLCQDPMMRQMAAVAVEQGRVQLQRITYDKKGKSTIEAWSQYRPIDMVKPSLGMLMFHVRAANAYAKLGVHVKANAALKMAHKAFQ